MPAGTDGIHIYECRKDSVFGREGENLSTARTWVQDRSRSQAILLFLQNSLPTLHAKEPHILSTWLFKIGLNLLKKRKGFRKNHLLCGEICTRQPARQEPQKRVDSWPGGNRMRGPRVEVESHASHGKKREGRNWRTREDRSRALSSAGK